MLVLSRKPGQSIVIADEIVITVCKVEGGKIVLAISAPLDIPVLRGELCCAQAGEPFVSEERRAMVEC